MEIEMSVLFQNFILASKLNGVLSLQYVHSLEYFLFWVIYSTRKKNESSDIHKLY